MAQDAYTVVRYVIPFASFGRVCVPPATLWPSLSVRHAWWVRGTNESTYGTLISITSQVSRGQAKSRVVCSKTRTSFEKSVRLSYDRTAKSQRLFVQEFALRRFQTKPNRRRLQCVTAPNTPAKVCTRTILVPRPQVSRSPPRHEPYTRDTDKPPVTCWRSNTHIAATLPKYTRLLSPLSSPS